MAQNIPASWNDAEQLDGLAIRDKRTLIDLPFRITGLSFRENDRGVEYVEIDAEEKSGVTFSFNDSSTSPDGIRNRMVRYVTDKNKSGIVASGEYLPMNLVIPNGLRVSEFEVEDADTGKKKMARTYYLTTTGKRETVTPKKKG